jgi:hypothetical protein
MSKLAALACLLSSGVAMADQTISDLTAEDERRLEQHRAVVTRYLADSGIEKYKTAAGKLGTLRALLEAQVFRADQTYELQSMGIVLGDVFVQDMGFRWVMVQDEYGRDPAVRFGDTSVILFPLTMISKRIEAGEKVDIFDLYNGVASRASYLIESESSR